MLRRLITALLLATGTVAPLFSQTQVCGSIQTDTTWSVAGSPYILCGDVVVEAGVTLTIDPGVTVQFPKPADDLLLDGTLLALGKATSGITFQGTGGRRGGSIALLQGSGGHQIEHATFERLGHETGSFEAALQVDTSDAIVRHTRFEHIETVGIRIDAAGVQPALEDLGFERVQRDDLVCHADAPERFERVDGVVRITQGPAGQTAWPQGTYLLRDHLTLGTGQGLTIAPGSEIRIAPGIILEVFGGFLHGVGSPTEPIVWTSSEMDAYGGRVRIRTGSAPCHLSHSEFRRLSGSINYPAAVHTTLRETTIEDCLFIECQRAGVYTSSVAPLLRRLRFLNTDIPVRAYPYSLERFEDIQGVVHLQGSTVRQWDALMPAGRYALQPLSGLAVEDGATLFIEPGVTLLFDGALPTQLTVDDGTLHAVGTVDDPIIFRGLDPLGSGNVLIESGQGHRMEHVRFERLGLQGSTGKPVGALVLGVEAEVRGAHFESCPEGGVRVPDPGVYPELHDITAVDTPAVVNVHPDAPARFGPLDVDIHILDRRLSNDRVWPLNTYRGTFLVEGNATLTLASGAHFRGSLEIAQGSRWVLEPGVRVEIPFLETITVEGSLVATGSAEQPIHLAAPADSAQHGGSLRFESNSSGHRMEHITFDRLGRGARNARVVLDHRGSDLTLTDAVLTSVFEDALHVTSSSPVVTRCDFDQVPGYAIRHWGVGTVQAGSNWWGDASGPTHSGNPGGVGALVSDRIDYAGWSTTPTRFSLEVSQRGPQEGSPLSVDVAYGSPSTLGVLYVTAINGVDTSAQVAAGSFDSSGRWRALDVLVPPGLIGLELELTAYGTDVFGDVAATPRVVLLFR